MDEKEWIKKYFFEFKNNVELAKTFSEKFYPVSSNAIRNKAGRLGLKRTDSNFDFGAKPLGSRRNQNGTIFVKVFDVKGKKNKDKNWVSLENVWWHRYYGVYASRNKKIIHLNGDKNDFSKENLMIANHNFHIQMKRNFDGIDKSLLKTASMIIIAESMIKEETTK